MIDFCNLSVQGGKSVYHTMGKMSKKLNDSFHREAERTGKHQLTSFNTYILASSVI